VNASKEKLAIMCCNEEFEPTVNDVKCFAEKYNIPELCSKKP